MRLQDLRVDDLMSTAVLSVKEGDTLSQADAAMRTADVRHLPVVDAHAHVVGILSDRDVSKALAVRGRARRKVAEFMTREVVTIHPRAVASEAASRMLQYKIGSLPVIDEDEQLVGVITETDLLRVAHQALRHGAEAELEWR